MTEPIQESFEFERQSAPDGWPPASPAESVQQSRIQIMKGLKTHIETLQPTQGRLLVILTPGTQMPSRNSAAA
jgi:hypothetical protein